MVETLSLSEAFEKYRLEYIVYRNQSARTEEMNRCAENALISYCGDIPVTDLTFDLVRKWKEHMSRTKSDNTVRGYILKLRVVLDYLIICGYQGILEPRRIGVPKRSSVKIDYFTPDEVSDIIRAIETKGEYTRTNRARNVAMISFLYASGVRVSELCALNIEDIHSDGSFVVIGKGKKIRPCFLDKRARDHLKTYLDMRTDHSRALFVTDETKERLSKSTVQFVFRNISRVYPTTKHIHPHAMRHSFATNLLSNNANLFHVSKLMGHASTQTTQEYLHYVDSDLRMAYEEKHTI